MPAFAHLRAIFVEEDGVEHSGALSEIDAWQVANGLPVRIPPSYVGQKHYPGHFWSATMGRHVLYESLLEKSWLWTADFEPSVVRIAAQPLLIDGFDGTAKRTRYPDFLTITTDSRVRVIDVKAPEALADADISAALDWTRSVTEGRGWSYEVWTGVDDTVLRNIQMIAAGRLPWAADEATVQAVVDDARSASTIEELEQMLALRELTSPPRVALFAALWAGKIRCDLTAPLRASSWIPAA